ncbi:hypothetical protein BJP24_22025 [Aeromonas allosaccharophila]|nr:hypothetical protein BJP24_22025 [Aeromonas allosaccharophila]
MRMATGRELPTVFTRYWDGWRMSGHHLITPAGTYLSRQRLEIIEVIRGRRPEGAERSCGAEAFAYLRTLTE